MENRFIEEVEAFVLDDGAKFAQTRAGAEVLRLARKQIALDQAALSAESSIARDTFIGRRGDMSPDGRLLLLKQPDGDICVSVVTAAHRVGVEFCTPGMGGGQSPKTFAALNQLALAVLADNAESPVFAADR